MRYGQLPISPRPGVALSCFECGERYSATRGDYFTSDPGETVTCGECDTPLVLTEKRVTFVRITPGKAEG